MPNPLRDILILESIKLRTDDKKYREEIKKVQLDMLDSCVDILCYKKGKHEKLISKLKKLRSIIQDA